MEDLCLQIDILQRRTSNISNCHSLGWGWFYWHLHGQIMDASKYNPASPKSLLAPQQWSVCSEISIVLSLWTFSQRIQNRILLAVHRESEVSFVQPSVVNFSCKYIGKGVQFSAIEWPWFQCSCLASWRQMLNSSSSSCWLVSTLHMTGLFFVPFLPTVLNLASMPYVAIFASNLIPNSNSSFFFCSN